MVLANKGFLLASPTLIQRQSSVMFLYNLIPTHCSGVQMGLNVNHGIISLQTCNASRVQWVDWREPLEFLHSTSTPAFKFSAFQALAWIKYNMHRWQFTDTRHRFRNLEAKQNTFRLKSQWYQLLQALIFILCCQNTRDFQSWDEGRHGLLLWPPLHGRKMVWYGWIRHNCHHCDQKCKPSSWTGRCLCHQMPLGMVCQVS